eukprot:TRINITY_DN6278_c0_g1_i1.p1 TRINITY_DN6278_c0_g1~~TRINITY_DN6278_c0_g1_i1.p1  ORF type:complete len:396 (-),score=60.39 TRINITY_DN6278_c0_g1_i1:509-1696(-)
MSTSPPARRRAGSAALVNGAGRRRTPSRSHSRARHHHRRHKHADPQRRQVSPAPPELPAAASSGGRDRSPLSAGSMPPGYARRRPNSRSMSPAHRRTRDQSSPRRPPSLHADPRDRRRPPSPHGAPGPIIRGSRDEPQFSRYPEDRSRFTDSRRPSGPPPDRFYDRPPGPTPVAPERGGPPPRDFHPGPPPERDSFMRRDLPPRDREFPPRDVGRDLGRERDFDGGRGASRGFDRDRPRLPVSRGRSLERDRDVMPPRRDVRSSRSRERDLEREKLGFGRDPAPRDSRDRGRKRESFDDDPREPKRMRGDGDERRFSVYVARIPADFHEADLRAFFADCGEILSLVVNEKDPGRKYAFVNFKDDESRNRAIELNGKPVRGVPLVVEIPSEGRRRR